MQTKFEIHAIEDNPGDQLLIRQGFEATNIDHAIHFSENGVEAMAFIQRTGLYVHAPRPHLILLDLNLSRKDGREILSEIKKMPDLITIPVVVFTTSNTTADIENCYRLGANAFVTKPADLDDFTDAINAIGQFWLKRVARPGNA